MFQYALYLSNKEKIDNLYIDLSWFDKNSIHNGFELKKIFSNNEKIKEVEKEQSFYHLKRNIFYRFFLKIKKKIGMYEVILDKYLYDENLLNKKYKKIFYIGYWQSELYFKEEESKIRQVYSFPELKDLKNKKVLSMIEKKESVSIHIRRGDYLNVPELNGLAPIEYYKRAITYIRERVENPIFLIFSNDIEWCKQNFNFLENQVIYVDWNIKENSYKDMQLMSLCQHNIIPNSSFSWWGAWLNKNPKKIVIGPEKWFTDNSGLNYEDIIPKSWIKIKNY